MARLKAPKLKKVRTATRSQCTYYHHTCSKVKAGLQRPLQRSTQKNFNSHGGGRPVGGIRAAASAADLEVYEPMVNSVFYPGPSASININDADGRTGNDSSARNYADPSSQQQLYAAAPAAATQNYSDASTSRLYPQESGERLGDYVNSDAAAGIVGIVGAPPSQAHIYENSTVNATPTTA